LSIESDYGGEYAIESGGNGESDVWISEDKKHEEHENHKDEQLVGLCFVIHGVHGWTTGLACSTALSMALSWLNTILTVAPVRAA